MKDNFLRIAAATPKIRVADPDYNTQQICRQMKEAAERGAGIVVFPELCITGYTCGDLFLQSLLIDRAKECLEEIALCSSSMNLLAGVGLPYEKDGCLYNVMAFVNRGEVLGFVTKSNIPSYSEFYEGRHFTPGLDCTYVDYRRADGSVMQVPFGSRLLFTCEDMPQLCAAAEICEDVWVPNPPSISHALAGATVILNGSASDETTGKRAYRRSLIEGQSARLVCAYAYASAGDGESTQDLVYSGHNLICENGNLLAESKPLGSGIIYADIDLDRLRSERRRMGTFKLSAQDERPYCRIPFCLKRETLKLERYVDPAPFVPHDDRHRAQRCEEIFSIQAAGLKKRLEHIGCRHAVVGLSGGLDSTLALLVMAKAYDMLGMERSGVEAVTMPCFGTTDRTYRNACRLAEYIGATLREVDIKDAVNQHFRDIGQDSAVKDVTYENSQARERTQVLMDLANRLGGIVIGTGDLSELALGWATYNGDHMSMYGVNASVPKTLVRHLVRYYADTCGDKELSEVLYDVLDTPVSPELLPPEDGKIAQKTESIVGPYELHDFFLYYMQRFGYRPKKVFRLAKKAFAGVYEDAVILNWLEVFYRRYFAQQFKRSCLPDGPKVGSVAVSPRGDLRMPSDASRSLWMEEIRELKEQLC